MLPHCKVLHQDLQFLIANKAYTYRADMDYNSKPLDFDSGPDSTLMPSYGSYSGFLLKLDTTGQFQWAKPYASGKDDQGIDLAMGLHLVTHNGHNFAFGKAFGKGQARNCTRPKLQKLNTYSTVHPCSVSRICS